MRFIMNARSTTKQGQQINIGKDSPETQALISTIIMNADDLKEAGTVSGGTVGDVAWNASHSGVEPGWTNNTANFSYPSNSPPSGGSYLPPTQYTNMTSGTYQITGAYNGSGNITVSGNVTLYVTGDFNLSGSDTITIKPGGSLKIIVGGNVSLGGGGVYNAPGSAANFGIVGLTSCTSVSYSGSAQFIGTVNAPQADLALKGSTDVLGAIIANSVSMNGNTALHYDESLAFQNAFIATSWQEL